MVQLEDGKSLRCANAPNHDVEDDDDDDFPNCAHAPENIVANFVGNINLLADVAAPNDGANLAGVENALANIEANNITEGDLVSVPNNASAPMFFFLQPMLVAMIPKWKQKIMMNQQLLV